MTEGEWQTCGNPDDLIACVRVGMSERKQRLCATAWARSVIRHPATNPQLQRDRHWIDDPKYEAQLDAAERFADGLCGAKEVRLARAGTGGPHNLFLTACRTHQFSFDAVWQTLRRFQREYRIPRDSELCAVLREVVNPFSRALPEPGWLAWGDGVVLRLAQDSFGAQAFGQLPILADALEDGGCSDTAILAHLRSPGPHVRGCWVLDLILGKQ